MSRPHTDIGRTCAIALALLVATIASSGCRDSGSAQYNGVTYDSTGSVAGTARLTIYTRDDSTATGNLGVISAAMRGGFAYAWRTPTGWTFRTVSSSGERILWQSTAREPWTEGQELRGSYEVEDGRMAGQHGTFDLSHAWGRGLEMRGQRAEFIGTAAIRGEGPLVLVLSTLAIALAVVAARWVAEVPAAEPVSKLDSPLRRDLTGVGGWMGWFLVGQSLTSLVMLWQVPALWSQLRNGSWSFMGAVPGMRALFALEIIVHVAQVVVPVIGIVLMLRHRPQVPRLWFAYLSLLGVYSIVELLLTSSINAGVNEVLMRAADGARNPTVSESLVNVRLAMFAAIWMAYWTRSDRVRFTFGRQALTDWRHGLHWPWAGWPKAYATPTETPVRSVSPAATLIGIALLVALASYFAITQSGRPPALEQTRTPNDSLRRDSVARHGGDCARYGRGCVS